MSNDDIPKMRKDMRLEDAVSITLPAHVWIGFVSAYSGAEYVEMNASYIARAALHELLDPLYLNEKEAEHQHQHDTHQAMMSRFLGTPPPDSTGFQFGEEP